MQDSSLKLAEPFLHEAVSGGGQFGMRALGPHLNASLIFSALLSAALVLAWSTSRTIHIQNKMVNGLLMAWRTHDTPNVARSSPFEYCSSCQPPSNRVSTVRQPSARHRSSHCCLVARVASATSKDDLREKESSRVELTGDGEQETVAPARGRAGGPETSLRVTLSQWRPSAQLREVGFISDLEGDLATFDRYLATGNSVLRRGDGGRLELASDTAGFVFGGDLFDRGVGDLRLARDLVDLKARYPDRIFLLMGNRDINKMRLTAELDADYVSQGNPHMAFNAWWDPNAPTLSEYLVREGWEDSQISRLRWMLTHTLGSPDAFEFRRDELKLVNRSGCQHCKDDGPSRAISDEEVVASFMTSVEQPDGEVAAYLAKAQLAVVIGDTLFVHGAVDEKAIGFVPSLLTKYKNNSLEEVNSYPGTRKDLPLQEWVDGLNAFAAASVSEWRAQPRWRQDGTRGGEALMAYQCRPAMALRTVTVTCYVDGKNMPTRAGITDVKEGLPLCSDPMNPAVRRYLREGGVRRIVVGHKPSGDMAAVLRIPGDDGLGFEVISADTNYASTQTRCKRGGSWCEVRIGMRCDESERFSSQTRLRGDLADGGGSYDFAIARLGTPSQQQPEHSTGDFGDPFVGHQTPDGWWVRVRLDDPDSLGAKYIVSRGRGRDMETKKLSSDELHVEDTPPSLVNPLGQEASRERKEA